MKSIVLLLILSFALPTFAVEKVCKARRGYEAHRSFCEGLSSFACKAHNSICREIIIPSEEGSCTARRGYEAHESFCDGLSEFSCQAHNSICRWIEGWGY